MLKIFRTSACDLGIDLGTANTLVYSKDQGIVLKEPSVVAVLRHTGKVLAVGEEARAMVGRTPGDIAVLRPLKNGVIADLDVAQHMLQYFIRKTVTSRLYKKPRVIIGTPSINTEMEKRAVVTAAMQAGAQNVYIIEETMAAAIGAGLAVEEPSGSMVVDIGAGTTDVAIISLGGIVRSQAIRIGGIEMDEAIIQYVKRTHSLVIGERTAEAVKISIGSTRVLRQDEARLEVRGRNMLTGLPGALMLSEQEVRLALAEPVAAIIEAVKSTLEGTPPELVADIIDRGMVLTGGGALLRGLDVLLSQVIGITVSVADDPLTCVARGSGKMLDNLKVLRH
ncbi:rod shape-determining protein MreB [Anaerospora hongkongensis]|uniref:Cell shape-determining protein MreB n=1 Tax=Anaerospora hongkongensis TaxID=244830 RepID=A0A4R1Q7K3_9FIRM|nr:rod shape-determining protein [Anaerospora hongkongensis]TCL37380.1 rod shape-determining protein MreB [Anaerospora hongkongensis]